MYWLKNNRLHEVHSFITGLFFLIFYSLSFNIHAGSDADYFKSIIQTYPDFPKEKIQFRDVLPIFKDPKAHHHMIDLLVNRYKESPVNCIAALDARGFLIGSTLAYLMNKPFVALRKQGKLPGETLKQSYDLEYGQATLEVKSGDIAPGDKVLLVDDLLATGGTAAAACSLIENSGASVFEFAVIVGKPEAIAELKGIDVLQGRGIHVHYLCTYAEE